MNTPDLSAHNRPDTTPPPPTLPITPAPTAAQLASASAPIANQSLADLHTHVQTAHALAQEALDLATASAQRHSPARTAALRLGPISGSAQGAHVEPDPRQQLAQAADAARHSGDRKSLMDYLELKRATA